MTSNDALVQDRVELEIQIAAPVERVWAVLTEGQHIGQWFGQGAPAELDLRPGGLMHLDHGENGTYATRIEKLDPPHYLSYRWASAYPGEVADDTNSTLVEWTLVPDGSGTLLRLVEGGFAGVVVPAGREYHASHESHLRGWSEILPALRQYAEQRTG